MQLLSDRLKRIKKLRAHFLTLKSVFILHTAYKLLNVEKQLIFMGIESRYYHMTSDVLKNNSISYLNLILILSHTIVYYVVVLTLLSLIIMYEKFHVLF